MTDIIFISFQFPPVVFGGVFRPLKFAKYLPEFGIRPHVYTLDEDSYRGVYRNEKKDYALLNELNGRDVRVTKVPMDSVFDKYKTKASAFWHIYFTIYGGSEYKIWEKYILEKVCRDSEENNFKAVLVTAPPFGMIKIGEKIAKKLNLPLILDMRDAWSLWLNAPYGSIFHYLLRKRRERQHLDFADSVVATTQQTIDDWKELHPGLDEAKFSCISNGYDDEKNEMAIIPFSIQPLSDDAVFTIAYVGSFYYSPQVRKDMLQPFYKKRGMKMIHYFPRKQDWLYRTPYFFFQALQVAFQKDPSLKNKIHIRFAGHKEPWLLDMVREFSLEENVEMLGLVSHSESLQIQRDADALLITSAKLIGGKDCFVAGKTFEYLSMNKPIFGFVAEGSQKDLLGKAGNTVFFDVDDAEAAASQLIELLKCGKNFNPDVEYIRSFERKKLTSKMAEVIQNTIHKF